MDIDKIKNEITSSHFLSTFITVFIILYIFTSLINFLGSYPMLIILSGIITYYINYKSKAKIINNENEKEK
jgi:hypothetical protein